MSYNTKFLNFRSNKMSLSSFHGPNCQSENCKTHTSYKIASGDERNIYHCQDCDNYFSQTQNTALEGLRKPLSFISTVLEAINEGMGINAACRTFKTTQKSINRWLERLGGLKETLLLYALCHKFRLVIIEGDELYTKVGKNKPPSESEGWTIVCLSRASRFIWELSCDEKETVLFENAIATMLQIIEQTDDISLVTDGELSSGNLLFDVCQEVIRTGEIGGPKTTLPIGVKVRIKNKGSQAHKKGPKRPKYQAPKPEHPQTKPNLEDEQILAQSCGSI